MFSIVLKLLLKTADQQEDKTEVICLKILKLTWSYYICLDIHDVSFLILVENDSYINNLKINTGTLE